MDGGRRETWSLEGFILEFQLLKFHNLIDDSHTSHAIRPFGGAGRAHVLRRLSVLHFCVFYRGFTPVSACALRRLPGMLDDGRASSWSWVLWRSSEGGAGGRGGRGKHRSRSCTWAPCLGGNSGLMYLCDSHVSPPLLSLELCSEHSIRVLLVVVMFFQSSTKEKFSYPAISRICNHRS